MRLITWGAIGRLVGGFGSAALFLWLCYPRPPKDRDFVGLLFIALAGGVGLIGAVIGGLLGARVGQSGRDRP